MSTRAVLSALAVFVATLTIPAVASARPIDEFGPLAQPSAEPVASSGPSPLLFVAAALAVVVFVLAVRAVSIHRVPVKA